LKNILYRGVSKKDYTEKNILPLETKRVPSNIPYIVDNIWEWLRPDDMPSRRFSAYASPKRELAEKYANDSSVICKIEFSGEYKAVQVVFHEDAKYHPDIKHINKILLQELSSDWFNSDLNNKLCFPLYLPSLDKEEVEEILSHYPLIKERLINESTFWKSVEHIDKLNKLTTGEVFFHAADGYKLVKC
jgi:hypothetical protein